MLPLRLAAAAAPAMATKFIEPAFVDRHGIERNVHGADEPHSDAPELWRFDDTEVDLRPGHEYKYAGHLWYVAGRAHEYIAQGRPIAGFPMNHAAREAVASGRVSLLKRKPGEDEEGGDGGDEADEADEIPGLEGLEEQPPRATVIGPSGKVYTATSLYCLRPGHHPRKAAILFVEFPLFDPVILITILCNCATMAWESPLDPPGTAKAGFIDVCEWVYLYIFTVEMLSKILAYGFFFGENAYLKDAWCQLDFVVVSLAWLPILFPSMGNYSVIRSVRALRPLRALKRMPGMPVLVNSILAALPALGNVVTLCGFLFVVLSIVGIELYQGELHYRCAIAGFVPTAGHPQVEGVHDPITTTGTGSAGGGGAGSGAGGVEDASSASGHGARLLGELLGALGGAAARGLSASGNDGGASDDGIAARVWGDGWHGRGLKGGHVTRTAGTFNLSEPHAQVDFDSAIACNPHQPSCPSAYPVCAYFDANINFGVTNFDNVGWAAIALLQALSFDGWTVPMYALMAATDDAVITTGFFLFVVRHGPSPSPLPTPTPTPPLTLNRTRNLRAAPCRWWSAASSSSTSSSRCSTRSLWRRRRSRRPSRPSSSARATRSADGRSSAPRCRRRRASRWPPPGRARSTRPRRGAGAAARRSARCSLPPSRAPTEALWRRRRPGGRAPRAPRRRRPPRRSSTAAAVRVRPRRPRGAPSSRPSSTPRGSATSRRASCCSI